MPKLIIAVACLVAGEKQPQHADVGMQIEASKDDAQLLTRAGRAYYMKREDDPTKGRLFAAPDILERIEREAADIAAQRNADAEAAAASRPMTQADVDAAVAKALAASKAPKADAAKPAA